MDYKNEKLELIKITEDKNIKKIIFASYLKADYIERALTLIIKDNSHLEEIHFSSNKYGTTEWQNGNGIINCHRWENEDMAQSQSYLSRHYTAILLDGDMNINYAHNFIIPDILINVADKKIAALIKDITVNNNFDGKIDLVDLGIE